MSADMGLFQNELQANVDSSIEMIEAVLAELGHDVAATRAERMAGELRRWDVTQSSTQVTVALVERSDFVHVRVVAPAMTLAAGVDRAELFERLLRLNASDIYHAAFAIEDERVILVSERTTRDLDRSEVKDVISRVCQYAASYR